MTWFIRLHPDRGTVDKEFLGLSQELDKEVRHFLSRLKRVASRYNFEIRCGCGLTKSFTEVIT